MARKSWTTSSGDTKLVVSLAGFACRNPECSHFNRFGVRCIGRSLSTRDLCDRSDEDGLSTRRDFGARGT